MTDTSPRVPTLRRAGPGDATAIRAVVDAAYGPSVELLGRLPLPMAADHDLAVREHEVWVLDTDGMVIGVLELIAREDHLWVENVAIDPRHQGTGLGRRLLDHSEQRASELGLEEIRLATNERYLFNIAMYRRRGFRETHREPVQGTDVIHFRKVLAPNTG
jgi:N-acetylglutamate synthase-like GNAT family acetyltransferase